MSYLLFIILTITLYTKELLEYLLSIGITIQGELVAEKPLKSNNYHIKYTEQWKNYKAGTMKQIHHQKLI